LKNRRRKKKKEEERRKKKEEGTNWVDKSYRYDRGFYFFLVS